MEDLESAHTSSALRSGMVSRESLIYRSAISGTIDNRVDETISTVTHSFHRIDTYK